MVTVSSRWSRLRGPMITAQSRLGEVTMRSQLNHGIDLQYDHSSVTARSQLNHGPGHGSATAGCDHFGHRELTVSSHGGQFFSHGMFLAATKQLYEWYFLSVCLSVRPSVRHTFLAATKQLYKWYFPSVRLSVCHTFLTMFPSSYHHEIFWSYYQ